MCKATFFECKIYCNLLVSLTPLSSTLCSPSSLPLRPRYIFLFIVNLLTEQNLYRIVKINFVIQLLSVFINLTSICAISSVLVSQSCIQNEYQQFLQNNCYSIFLDIALAFDRVWHEDLIHELKSILPYKQLLKLRN